MNHLCLCLQPSYQQPALQDYKNDLGYTFNFEYRVGKKNGGAEALVSCAIEIQTIKSRPTTEIIKFYVPHKR